MKPYWHLVLLCGFSSAVLAQTNPNLETGFTPFGSYDTASFDSVSLTNGNLILHIPLFDYPQRGDLDDRVFLTYNAKGWTVYLDCISQGNCTPLWQWRTGATQHGMALTSGDEGVYSVSWRAVGSVDVFTATDFWDGTHQIAQLTNGSGYRSIDASGLYYNGWVGLPGTTEKLLDRRGRGINYNTQWGDPNGNYLGIGGSPDTLGRTGGGSTSSDSTGCGGPLPITSATIWNFNAPNGGTRSVKLCSVTATLQTNFQAYTYANGGARQKITEGTYGSTLIQSAIVFDGTSWSTSPQWIFEYNDRDSGDPSTVNYGSLTKITLPTGGTVTYTWGTVRLCGTLALTTASRGITSRTTNANDGMGAQMTTYIPGSILNKVTDPAGNVTVHTITGLGGSCSQYETQTDYYKGAVAAANLLKTVQIGYHWTLNPFDQYGDGAETVANVVQTSVTTKWPVGSNYLVSQVQTDYDSSFTFNPNSASGGTYGLMTEKREYSYATNAPGALLRKTDYTYAALTNSNYLTANLLNLVAQETVYDLSANKVAQTTNTYDGTTLQSSGVTTQHFSLANPGYRGNLALVQKWLNTGGTVTTSQTQYYDTGMPYISTDLKNNQTQYTYDPAYVGAYVTKTQYPNTGNGITHYIQGAYDFNTGFLTSFTDQNLQVSNYGYDVLGRITSGSYPDGGSVGFQYTDTVPVQIQKTVAITSTLSKVTNSVFDGLGRLSELQLQDPDCTVGSALVKTDYAYGNDTTQNTHYTIVTTPYCDTPGTTFGLPIRTDSDTLGRALKITQADGSVATTSYAASSTTLSECTTATDEAGKSRTSCADALGRMNGVWEDPGTSPHLNYETDYGYNLLDDLTAVNQKGDNSAPRTRSFVYDALSRLTSATNPESGAISYTYSNNSSGCAGTPNVICAKTALSPNQPSTGTAMVTTTYTYDALNRLTQKSYADLYPGNPVTPAVQYGYDGTALAGCTTSPPSLTDSYPVGLRTAMCDGSGATSWAHDKMGRALQAESIRARATKNVFDTYNLDGSVASLTTVGYALNYKYSAAGRPISVKNTVDPFNYVTSATYAPFGGLATASLGAQPITISNQYNSRLQPSLLSASAAATIMSLSYDFHSSTQTNNGNVFQIANNRDNNRTQNFLYDSLNRIQQAYTTGTNWGETFGIDPWGNLLNRSGVTGKTNTEPLSCSVNTNNQLTACSFNYDAAGNMISNGTTTYTYDDENRLIATAGMAYLYDGDGTRVEKCTGSTTTPGTCATGATGTLYWGSGAETDLSGNTLEDYIFFNGQRIARREPGTPAIFHFYFSDHLGTHSLITDQNGDMPPQSESDYYPYGGEIPITTGDLNHFKFTGKERDSESGLDYFGARYYGSSLARFIQIDPKVISRKKMVDPQQWNMYPYSRNNPTSYFDPDGREVQALDAGALNQIRQTLPASVRSSVVADKSGFISGKALSGVKSNDANFQTLQHMVDAKGTVQVSTGPTATDKSGKTVEFKYESSDAVKADLQGKGITPTSGKDYSTNFSGITYGADESKSGNIEVHVSDATGKASTLPGEEETVTMGHELYVHGDRLLDGRPAEHENSPNGEVNKETHEVEQRTRENAKQKDPQ